MSSRVDRESLMMAYGVAARPNESDVVEAEDALRAQKNSASLLLAPPRMVFQSSQQQAARPAGADGELRDQNIRLNLAVSGKGRGYQRGGERERTAPVAVAEDRDRRQTGTYSPRENLIREYRAKDANPRFKGDRGGNEADLSDRQAGPGASGSSRRHDNEGKLM
jgi:hypothetical protein